ncbi:MAG: four helix bundle protein [Gemmatimonadota bacterium]|nr:four helix bundle protein [Gemmatimonadota bacterium]
MRDFRKLIAWQKAHALAVTVHQIGNASNFRPAPGLRSQLLRAADSVPANIAEGAGKESESEFARFLEIALGSAREVDNHLMLAKALDCVDGRHSESLLTDVDEVKRILYSLSRVVRQRASTRLS